MNQDSNASSYGLFDVRPQINQGPHTTKPPASWWEVEYTSGLGHYGIMQIGGALVRLQFQFQALRWWRRLWQGTAYEWRLECLYRLSRAYHWMEETYGQEQHGAPRYDWGLFLDSCTRMIVQEWSAMPWQQRWRYVVKTLTWLRYLQELRPFDWARMLAEAGYPVKPPEPSGESNPPQQLEGSPP